MERIITRLTDWNIIRRIVYWEQMREDDVRFAAHWLGLHNSPYYSQALREMYRRERPAAGPRQYASSPTVLQDLSQTADLPGKNEVRGERKTFSQLTGAEKLYVLEGGSRQVADYFGVTIRSVQLWKRRLKGL